MPQLFYKKNGGSAVHVASLAHIESPIDYYALGSSSISSGSSYYTTSVAGGGIGGHYPAYDDPNNSTIYYTGITAAGSRSESYTTSNTDNIYTANIESFYNESLGGATEITGWSDGDYITFCDSKGKESPVTLSVSVSYGAYSVKYFTFSMKCSAVSTGSWSIQIDTESSTIETFDHLFLFTDGSGSLGIATFCTSSEYVRPRYSSTICDFSIIYYTAHPYISPFFRYLEYNDIVYGASGSSTDNATAGGAQSSGERGGVGTYSFDNADISSSDDMPSSSPAISAGLVNPYYVTASEIASLGNFLWSSEFFDSISKTFSNPMDCIISLSSFPIVSSSISLGSSESVRVGNTTSSSTGTRLISEFVTIDCGSVSVPEVWGSYLDYAQTKLYIYIPYLGIEELPLCECMGGTVACVLRINLLTGALVACVTLTSGTYVTGSARVQPIYFSTTCKSDIPVSGATTGALAGAFQLLGGAVSSVAGIATGVAPLAISGLASAAQGVATMQSQNSQISGAVGAAGGQMAHKIPFLIFDRPVQSVPANLASVAGYQSNSGTTLSRCSGFVICDTINLDGLALTRSELEEVEQICTSGVYIS